MILWAIRNWRIVSCIISIICILGFISYVYHRGGSDREDKIVSEAFIAKQSEKERLDEVRNTPIDTDNIIERLRAHTY